MSEWTFLTNHARTLECIAQDPNVRVKDIATAVGITERAAHRIVGDLCRDGYISRERRGRCNVYELHTERPLRGSLQERRLVGDLFGDPAPSGGLTQEAA